MNTKWDVSITVTGHARDKVGNELDVLVSACKEKGVTLNYSLHADDIEEAKRVYRESVSSSRTE